MLIFSAKRESDLNLWKVVDDRVMGGVSKGKVNLDEQGFLVFEGYVSLENDGGFTSVHLDTGLLDVSHFSRVKLRVKGDGKRYQFRLKSDLNDNYAYVKFFDTSGQWQDLEMHLSEFIPRFRGKSMDLPAFDKKKVEQIAFLIANKSEEDFKLTIDEIELIE